ncbi:MAG TPA: lysylphosphatidylglycerol synthase transmembrane domain-containing protein [Wenzhouxiangella sp.]
MLSRWLLSLGLLGALVWWLGPLELLDQLSGFDGTWLWLALAIGLIQVMLSAFRWHFTARSLGLDLSFLAAWREYYLASLINQVLPGGVVGDAYRAKRHADQSTRRGRAWLAVVIERFSGQLMLVILTLGVVVFSKTWHQALTRWFPNLALVSGVFIVIGLVLGLFILYSLLRRTNRWHVIESGWIAPAIQGVQQAFWPVGRLGVQLLSSGLILLSYIAIFVLAARAMGVELPTTTLTILAPPLLLAMVIPITVSGWGLREAAAAGAWGILGLDPAQGVAVSVAYGVLIFLIALPGVVLWRPVANPR